MTNPSENITDHEVVQAVLSEWQNIAFANIADYYDVAADGTLYVDMTSIPRAQAAAISEITIEPVGGTARQKLDMDDDTHPKQKVRIKLIDKKYALDALAKYEGLFKDPDAAPVAIYIDGVASKF